MADADPIASPVPSVPPLPLTPARREPTPKGPLNVVAGDDAPIAAPDLTPVRGVRSIPPSAAAKVGRQTGRPFQWRVLAAATVLTCAITGGAIAAVLAERRAPRAARVDQVQGSATARIASPEATTTGAPRGGSAGIAASGTVPARPAPATVPNARTGSATASRAAPGRAPRAAPAPGPLAGTPRGSAPAAPPIAPAPRAVAPGGIPDEPTDGALAAAAARARGPVQRCGDGTPHRAEVTVTFSTMGLPTSVRVAPPLAGTPVADCIVRAVRASARVPPFRAASYEDGAWTFALH